MLDTDKQKHEAAIIIGIVSVVFGVLFNYFFYEKTAGISVPIYFFLLTATIVFFHVCFARKSAADLWFGLPLLFFAGMAAVRDNQFLTFLNVASALGLLFLTVKNAAGFKIKFFDIGDYFRNIVMLPIDFLKSELNFFRFLGLSSGSVKPKNSIVRRVLIGSVAAVPLLIIFVGLFSSADMVFGNYIDSIFTFEISDDAVARVVLFAISAFAVSFILWNLIVSGRREEAEDSASRALGVSRSVEILTCLSLVAVLFLFFIFFQITYLFGGEWNIVNSGFTYAEYARQGFWELLVAAVITLAVLLFAERVSDNTNGDRRAFMMPAVVIIGAVLVIIASAFKRLNLYVLAYGETAPRFYAASFIFFLLVIFGILCYRIIRKKHESFLAYGALITLIAGMMVINFVNPDAFIARKNFELYAKTGKIDFDYLKSLSADAVPELIKNINTVRGGEEKILEILVSKKENLSGGPWQSWNYSRLKSASVLGK